MTFKFIESQSASGKEDGDIFGTKGCHISGDSFELVRSAPSDYSKQVLLEQIGPILTLSISEVVALL